MTFTNCTVACNQVSASSNGTLSGGGLYSAAALGQGPVVKHTIFADNTGASNDDGPDAYGHIQSQDYNLIRNINGYTLTGSIAHNVTGQDPKLGPLADNGGDTFTHALLDGSPAIDAGSDTDCPATDQRGKPRIGICDIGAYEYVLQAYLPLVMRNF